MNREEIDSLLNNIINSKEQDSANWVNICEVLSKNVKNSKYFVTKIKEELKKANNPNYLMILYLLDFLMDNSTLPFHTQVSSKDFLNALLNLLKFKEFPEIQGKVLSLIQKWGIAFEYQKDILPNFYYTYINLKNNGVMFPNENLYINEYLKYISPKEQKIESNNSINPILDINSFPQIPNDDKNEDEEYIDDFSDNNYGEVKLDLNKENYNRKYSSFIDSLSVLLNHIILVNEMIDNFNFSNFEIDESLTDMMNSINQIGESLQNSIIDITDQKLMNISIGINDDINQVNERFNNILGNIKPKPFKSCFTKNEFKQYNLYRKKKVKKPVELHKISIKPNKTDNNINTNFSNNNINNIIDINKETVNNEIPNKNDEINLLFFDNSNLNNQNEDEHIKNNTNKDSVVANQQVNQNQLNDLFFSLNNLDNNKITDQENKKDDNLNDLLLNPNFKDSPVDNNKPTDDKNKTKENNQKKLENDLMNIFDFSN